jgi:hypothetical protein
MSLKSQFIKGYAKKATAHLRKWAGRPIEAQQKVFKHLIRRAKNTQFGKDHGFEGIHNVNDFRKSVPIRDYEGIRNYIDLIIAGNSSVLWPGKPKYFAKTSGTTSGVKYIPISRESMPNHITTARNTLFRYISETANASIFGGKMIFLSGSPELGKTGGIHIGRLSGIVNHELPFYVKSNRLPSDETNMIEDWETKLDRIVDETIDQDMRMISGIPPWVQMYYERLLERSGKATIKELFPNYTLFVHGGVNFEPYKASLEALVGEKIDTLETYPASEGFIAFQDSRDAEGLLLNTFSGIFFEFVPVSQFFDENPDRLTLSDVELGKDYAVILSNNAGLWAYNLGDTVRFVSKTPYRIIVSGRIKHFISAFGEHVIGKEVEEALLTAAEEFNCKIVEFTVAPQVNPKEGGLPYHEWFVEFDPMPNNLDNISTRVDELMREQNIYYDDLIVGNILRPLVIRTLNKNAFREYMKSKGKLGGQNKVPRLANDRKIADELETYISTVRAV